MTFYAIGARGGMSSCGPFPASIKLSLPTGPKIILQGSNLEIKSSFGNWDGPWCVRFSSAGTRWFYILTSEWSDLVKKWKLLNDML